MTKLIILRGPSASGKSTIAKLLRDSFEEPCALLDFDIYKGTFLDKQGDFYLAAAKMITQSAAIALESGYNVVIDGIYRPEKYPNLLDDLFKQHPKGNFMFFFDISLDETITRHKGREKFKEFDVEQLKKWYYIPKFTDMYDFEYKIDQNLTKKEALEYILEIINTPQS